MKFAYSFAFLQTLRPALWVKLVSVLVFGLGFIRSPTSSVCVFRFTALPPPVSPGVPVLEVKFKAISLSSPIGTRALELLLLLLLPYFNSPRPFLSCDPVV